MGNNCTNKSTVEPSIISNAKSNIERSFRNSKKLYINKVILPNVRFDEKNIFHSNPNSENNIDFDETNSTFDCYRNDDRSKKFELKSKELDSREFAELIDDKRKQYDIQELNESSEFIENIVRALVRAKLAIDGCTYDECHQRFHYSIVPYVDTSQ